MYNSARGKNMNSKIVKTIIAVQVLIMLTMGVLLYHNEKRVAELIESNAIVECGSSRAYGTPCVDGETVMVYETANNWKSCVVTAIEHLGSYRNSVCHLVTDTVGNGIGGLINANRIISRLGFYESTEVVLLDITQTGFLSDPSISNEHSEQE